MSTILELTKVTAKKVFSSQRSEELNDASDSVTMQCKHVQRVCEHHGELREFAVWTTMVLEKTL